MHGVYLADDHEASYGWAIQAMRQRLGPDPVLLGPSAAFAHGVTLAGEGDVVHVGVDPARVLKPRPEVVSHRGVIEPRDVMTTALGSASTPARTAVDLARGIGTARMPDDERLATVEAFLAGSGVRVAEAKRVARLMSGRHGLPQARRLLRAARDGVGSPRETLLRLLVIRHGFEEPTVQCPVELAGRVMARLDLGWPEHRVGLEYDGQVHLERRQHSRDLVRHNRIRAAGWDVLQVDAHAFGHPEEFLAQLAAWLPLSHP